MKRSIGALLTIAVATLAIVPSRGLLAQASNNFQFNIAAGASFPTGKLGQNYNLGYDLTVGIGMHQPLSPLGFRVEGMYNEWGYNRGSSFTAHAGGVSGNLTYDLATPSAQSRGPGNSLYVIGGVGLFGTGRGSTDMGLNAGGGFKFPLSGFSAYVEARYHSISNAHMSFVPVVFGLIF